jgi:hypothetical protein
VVDRNPEMLKKYRWRDVSMKGTTKRRISLHCLQMNV